MKSGLFNITLDMIWTATLKYDLLNNCKTLTVILATSIARKLDLGQPIDGYLDDLYFMCNVTFALEEASVVLVDADFDYLNSVYNKIRNIHNRYKGLIIPAHHDAH